MVKTIFEQQIEQELIKELIKNIKYNNGVCRLLNDGVDKDIERCI